MGRCLGADLRERWVDLLEGRYSRLNFFKKKRGGGGRWCRNWTSLFICVFGFGVVYIGMGSGAGVMGDTKKVGRGRKICIYLLDVKYER
jgi:hypothetical protein